jgi:hypothetical protein
MNNNLKQRKHREAVAQNRLSSNMTGEIISYAGVDGLELPLSLSLAYE